MTLPTFRCFLLSFFLVPLTLSAQSAQSHRPATAPPAHHAVAHVSHCVVPPPTLSPKIPSTPATLGCPKLEYALTYLDTKIGTGDLVQPRKLLTVAYTGYLTDGTKFDSSYDHPDKKPITFPYALHQVIPGWDTGFEGMHVGGKRRLFIPYELAYGETGRPPVIPPKSELIFDVEVISQADLPQGPPGGFRPPMPGRPGQPSNPGANPNGGTPPPAGTAPAGPPNPQGTTPPPPPTSQPQMHPATPQPQQPQTTPPPAGNPPGSTQPQPQ